MDSKRPKVSIITPSSNQVQFIEATIQSALNQRYPNIEYIVGDGCSTVQIMGAVNYYKSYINIIIYEKDKGYSDETNKWLKMATGELIGSLIERGILFVFYLWLMYYSLYQLTNYYKLNTSFAIFPTFINLFSKVFFDVPLFHVLIFIGLMMSTRYKNQFYTFFDHILHIPRKVVNEQTQFYINQLS